MNNKIFEIYRCSGHIVIRLWFIKIRFKNIFINQLADCCDIPNLKLLLKNGTIFPHPVGIVISKDAKIGTECRIYQNVTIGKKNGLNNEKAPVIGNKVKIYPNSVIIGDITIGDNAIIGAGSVVIHDVPKNSVVAGNPAKIIGGGANE